MWSTCRRLAFTSVEVWRRAQFLGEVAIAQAEERMLEKEPVKALSALTEADKKLRQGNAMHKRANIMSTQVRALSALKLARVLARLGASRRACRGALDAGSGVVAFDARPVTFERLLGAMLSQARAQRQELEDTALKCVGAALSALQGGPRWAVDSVEQALDDEWEGGEYQAARDLLQHAAVCCARIQQPSLEMNTRVKIGEQVDEAEAAERRGTNLLSQASEAIAGSLELVEARELLTSARSEFVAAFALHRHDAALSRCESELSSLETTAVSRGCSLLQDAVRVLSEDGAPQQARELVGQAYGIFEPLGGYDNAGLVASGRPIKLEYFMVGGRRMRLSRIGVKEKQLMSAQERAAWDRRPRPSLKRLKTVAKLVVGVQSMAHSSSPQTGGTPLLPGQAPVYLPDFSQVSNVTSAEVDSLLRSISQCEEGHKSAETYLHQARKAVSNFMFGIARKHTECGLRFATSCFAHHLKADLHDIEQQIADQIEAAVSHGHSQVDRAQRLLGDLRITSAAAPLDPLGGQDELSFDLGEAWDIRTIEGHGDARAAQEALQTARFHYGACGNQAEMARCSDMKTQIDALLNLTSAQSKGIPQALEYGGQVRFEAQVNLMFQSPAPTLDGEAPDAPRWVEAKAGPLEFLVHPELMRGLTLDRLSGVISGVPEVAGTGTFELRVSNALGTTSLHVSFHVAQDPVLLAQATPRLQRRIQLMRAHDAERAEREILREQQERLNRFSGPFPAAYQVGLKHDPFAPAPGGRRATRAQMLDHSLQGSSSLEASGADSSTGLHQPANRARSGRMTGRHVASASKAPGMSLGHAAGKELSATQDDEASWDSSFVAASPGMTRGQLQVVYKDYRLY